MKEQKMLIFGYWAYRGRAQISRLLLAYTETPWIDVRYAEPQKWYNGDRTQLGFDFPNLPYLIDGNFKLTQSSAINFYILERSSKPDVLGRDIRDRATVQSILSYADCMSQIISAYLKSPSNITLAATEAGEKLKKIEAIFAGKQFALGYVTLVDFRMAQISYYIEKISAKLYEEFPFLRRCRNSINQLAEVKKYYESENAMMSPFLSDNSGIKF